MIGAAPGGPIRRRGLQRELQRVGEANQPKRRGGYSLQQLLEQQNGRRLASGTPFKPRMDGSQASLLPSRMFEQAEPA